MRNYFLLCILFIDVIFASGWDLEYWQRLKFDNFKTGNSTFYTSFEARFNKDASTFYYLRATEHYLYAFKSWLDLEFHYSFIHHHSRGATSFTNVHRFEFEANPHYTFNNGATLSLRNRYELEKNEHNPVWQNVMRERIRYELPLENRGALIAIGFTEELFYHFNQKRFTQNEWVPLYLTFRIGKAASIECYSMVRNFYSANKWYRSMVMGTNLEF